MNSASFNNNNFNNFFTCPTDWVASVGPTAKRAENNQQNNSPKLQWPKNNRKIGNRVKKL